MAVNRVMEHGRASCREPTEGSESLVLPVSGFLRNPIPGNHMNPQWLTCYEFGRTAVAIFVQML
jgi:hypothetical protein